jgi:hypothetical protein
VNSQSLTISILIAVIFFAFGRWTTLPIVVDSRSVSDQLTPLKYIFSKFRTYFTLALADLPDSMNSHRWMLKSFGRNFTASTYYSVSAVGGAVALLCIFRM